MVRILFLLSVSQVFTSDVLRVMRFLDTLLLRKQKSGAGHSRNFDVSDSARKNYRYIKVLETLNSIEQSGNQCQIVPDSATYRFPKVLETLKSINLECGSQC